MRPYEMVAAGEAKAGTLPHARSAFLEPGLFTRLHRCVRDAWDVFRWTRSPLELLRAVAPLPARLADVRILNAARSGEHETRSADQLVTDLARLKQILRAESIRGNRVAYDRLATSSTYADLCCQTLDLPRVAPERLSSDAERIAFWLNLYNVLSIHGVIVFGVRRSVMEMPSFFVRAAYRVGRHVFTLDDISNGVLRGAARRPSTGRPQFRRDDPRRACCVSVVDPRIHGALVCAAVSCPPIACYQPDRLEEQLDVAAGHLVDESVRVDETRRRVHLPLQFYYYVSDFGGWPGVERFMLRHAHEAARPRLSRAIAERWKVVWDPYDWGLNASG